MEKYYVLYDLQIDGFKGGFADTSESNLLMNSAFQIVELAQNDEEPPTITNDTENEYKDVLEVYGYEIVEVSKEVYEIVRASDTLFLSEVVDLDI